MHSLFDSCPLHSTRNDVLSSKESTRQSPRDLVKLPGTEYGAFTKHLYVVRMSRRHEISVIRITITRERVTGEPRITDDVAINSLPEIHESVTW